MRVEASQSEYQEAADAVTEFNRMELKRCRLLLRRLRYLERKVKESGGLTNPSGSGGAAFVEWEVEALEWVLTEVGYLQERKQG